MMGDFFKPWRRKIGVVTLVMAYVFATAWVRSFSVTDWLSFSGHGKEILPLRFVSSEGSIAIIPTMRTSVIDVIRTIDWKVPDLYSRPAISLEKQPGVWFNWRWKLCGFGSATEKSRRYQLFKLPYSSIVIPLTMLSAYLLLSKPRSAKTASIEPQSPPSSQP